MAVQKQDDKHEHTFSSYVRIRNVVLKTYLGRWTIGRSGERGSGISVLPARHDGDDEGLYQVLPLRCEMELGAMAMKRYSTFPSDPTLLEPRHYIVWCHIQNSHSWGGGSYPSAELQSVYSAAPVGCTSLCIVEHNRLQAALKNQFWNL